MSYLIIIQAELCWRTCGYIKKANYYIAFIILSEALEDPSFNLPWIHILNSVLNYFYVGLLVMCFLLSLGNRPQGSKWGYTLAMIGFALITIYMTVWLSYYCFRFALHSYHFLNRFRRFYLLLKALKVWLHRVQSTLALFSPTIFSEISCFRLQLHLGCIWLLQLYSWVFFPPPFFRKRKMYWILTITLCSLNLGTWSLPLSNTCWWHLHILTFWMFML